MPQRREKVGPDEPSILDVACPECGHKFRLSWGDNSCGNDQDSSLEICGCESDPIYGISVKCPKCGYEERMY